MTAISIGTKQKYFVVTFLFLSHILYPFHTFAHLDGNAGETQAQSAMAASSAAASGGMAAASAGAAAGAAGIAMDAVGKGKSHIPPQLQADLQALVATTQSGVSVPGLATAQSAIQAYLKAQPACIADQARASGFCREQTNPDLQNTLMMVNGFMSGASALGVTDSCSSAGKVLDMAKLGLTAYTAACGAMRYKCESACRTAVQAATQAKTALASGPASCSNPSPACIAVAANANGLIGVMVSALEQELNRADPMAVHGKQALCTHEYGRLLLTAGIGIFSTLNSFKQAKNCEKETKAAGKSDSDQFLAATCNKKENASIPECICLANPRNTGCANNLIKLGNGDAAKVATGSGNTSISTGSSRSPADSSQSFAGDASPPSADGSLSAQGGGFAGSGAGSGGFETGASGKDAAGKEKAAEKFPGSYANGADGMAGGGGGGWDAGGAGGGDSVYAAYLPGGQLDPGLMTGDTAGGSSDITSQGGDTNFQKIKLRFGVIRGSLMDQ